ncbi:MAG: YggS family pyridoxal phosphate-dependent enzyme [Chthoniobacteraceae bacterium]
MIAENIASLRARIAQAAGRSLRRPEEITLVAVSKTHGPEAVLEAAQAGLTVFGENRVQEARAKAPLVGAPVSWHLIGPLQSNKVRQALGLFERIHSIDKVDLARDVDRIAGELGLKPKVFLEVNVGGEGSKFGFDPGALRVAMPELLALGHLSIDGLMAIPPWVAEPSEARPYFVALRELRDRLAAEFGVQLPELSMGMSGDFEVAIEEGATFVRVGTALFGERQGKAWKP